MGTFVRVRCCGIDSAAAATKIDTAFAQIERIQELMGFHQPASDVSRMNALAAHGPVRVHPDTFTVLEHALALSKLSGGAFDNSIADWMVAHHHLPERHLGLRPDANASWRDIELIAPDLVRFHRPLWIDLGGIAKGFAVDCAISSVNDDHRASWCINAGGDMRVTGPITERVLLHQPDAPSILELENASLASSHSGCAQPEAMGIHLDGRSRQPIKANHFVSVVAPDCMMADALTKIVLSQTEQADEILRSFAAAAFSFRPDRGWVTLGASQ